MSVLPLRVQPMIQLLIPSNLLAELRLPLRLFLDDAHTPADLTGILRAAAIHIPLLPSDVGQFARVLR